MKTTLAILLLALVTSLAYAKPEAKPTKKPEVASKATSKAKAKAKSEAPSFMPREEALEVALATAQRDNLQLQIDKLQRQLAEGSEAVQKAIAERDATLKKYGIAPGDYGRTVGVDLNSCGKGGCPIVHTPKPQ